MRKVKFGNNFWLCQKLFCVFNSTAFSDEVNLDLSGVIHLVFNLLSDFTSDDNHLFVVDLVREYHDTDFTACLDSKGLFNAVKGCTDFFKLLKTLDVVFVVFASCTGTCCGNRVGSLNQGSDNCLRLYVTVVSFDSVDNICIFLVLAADINTDLNV